MKSILIVIPALFFVQCSSIPGLDEKKPDSLAKNELELVNADNAFGFDLFNRVNDDEAGKNVFISPVSISMALGMTMNGARDATRDGMRDGLHLTGWNEDAINESYRSLMDNLTGLDPKVEFTIANSIWYRNGLPVRDEFVNTNREYFDSEVRSLNFSASGSGDIINGWISDKTNEKIKSAVPQNLPEEAMMYLVNAIYFKGAWKVEFDKKQTRKEAFNAPGTMVQADMMNARDTHRYYGDNQAQIIDLPYGNGNYSMSVILPGAGTDIEEFVSQLTPEKWSEWQSKLAPREVVLAVPRFKMEYEKTLNRMLIEMGMENAFSDGANFSGIVEGGLLKISTVKHKSFVEVNEEGTEAAAVTVVEIVVTSTRYEEKPVTVMRVDRPFVFVIHEKGSGAILFMGKIVNPTV